MEIGKSNLSGIDRGGQRNLIFLMYVFEYFEVDGSIQYPNVHESNKNLIKINNGNLINFY